MTEIISTHPLATIAFVWLIVLAIFCLVFYKRYRDHQSDTVFVETHDDGQLTLELRAEDRITPELEQMQDRLRRFHSGGVISHADFLMPGQRIAMRSRFLPPTEGEATMADQILHDQAVAHEEPGAVVEDPAVEPDATTFYHLREVIGQFTYVLGKDDYVGVVEAMRSGEDAPIVEVPEEWREPITVAVFEVARLRHG